MWQIIIYKLSSKFNFLNWFDAKKYILSKTLEECLNIIFLFGLMQENTYFQKL